MCSNTFCFVLENLICSYRQTNYVRKTSPPGYLYVCVFFTSKSPEKFVCVQKSLKKVASGQKADIFKSFFRSLFRSKARFHSTACSLRPERSIVLKTKDAVVRSAIRFLISTEIRRLREMKFVYVNNESDWCDQNIARGS